jgi:DnaK suppressor protein
MSPKARKAEAGAKSGRAAKAATPKAAPKGKKKAAKRATRAGRPAAKKKTPAKAVAPARKKKAAKAPAKAPAAPKRRKKAAASKAAKPKKPRRVRLGPKQVEHYRNLLLEKQRGLTAAYHTSKGESRSDLDDGTEDYIDYAVHSYAREFLLSLSELDRKQLYLVEDALERLGRNEFGNCQQCQQPIHPKRLEVAPWARYCVPCQELEEQGLLPDLDSAEAADAASAEDEDEGAAAAGVDEDEADGDEGEEGDEGTLVSDDDRA